MNIKSKEYWQERQNEINIARKKMDIVFEGKDMNKLWTFEMNEAWKKWHSLERATVDAFGFLRKSAGVNC